MQWDVRDVLIFIFILIEAWQLRALLTTSRRQTSLIDQLINDKRVAGAILKNGIIGLAESVKQSPEIAKAFFSFMGDVAQQAWANVKDSGVDEAVRDRIITFLRDMQADEELQKEVFSFIATAGEVAFRNATNATTDKVKETIKREIPVPRKWRWLYEVYQQEKEKDNGKTTQPANQSTGLLPLQ